MMILLFLLIILIMSATLNTITIGRLPQEFHKCPDIIVICEREKVEEERLKIYCSRR